MNKILKRRIWERVKFGILLLIVYIILLYKITYTQGIVLFLSVCCLFVFFILHCLILTCETTIINGKSLVDYMNEVK